MISRRPENPRPSNRPPGRSGQRPNPSESPPERREQMLSSPVQTVADWVRPPEEAEVIPISSSEDKAVDIIQRIHSVQEMIRQYTHRLSLNPNRTHTINILRTFQETEKHYLTN